MRLPLKLRLTLVFGVGMAVVLVGLGTYGYFRVAADLLISVDAGLRSRAQVLANSIGRSDGPNGALSEGKLIDPDEAFAQVLDDSGRIVDASSAVPNVPLLTAAEVRSISRPMFVTRQIDDVDPDDPFRLLAVSIDRPVRRIVIVGATLSDVDEALQRLFQVIVTIGPLLILLMTGAGWLLAGAALSPVEEMRREAAAVSASEPGRRLPVPRTGDELARLATTLNSMLDRLQEAIERERRFVDSASHELRTPLATLRAEIDLALLRRREVPELEGSLRSAQEDVSHLQRLTEDFLVLARSRGGRLPVRRVKTRLAALITKSRQSVDSQARAADVRIDIEAADAEVEIDSDRVHQALRNLLENAIRHTPRDGTVRVSAARIDGIVRMVVTDSGPGFSPKLLAAVVDPFTGGNSDLSTPSGTGLGLAIVRAVAKAHGGSFSVENTPDGARVTLEVRT
jgi:signal transduction histidine kinase